MLLIDRADTQNRLAQPLVFILRRVVLLCLSLFTLTLSGCGYGLALDLFIATTAVKVIAVSTDDKSEYHNSSTHSDSNINSMVNDKGVDNEH